MHAIKRLNANIPVELYSEAKSIFEEQGKTITDFIIETMRKTVQEYKMIKMIEVYNKLADSPSTEEAMTWEETCISDGLNVSEAL
jgi:hypothetical protein